MYKFRALTAIYLGIFLAPVHAAPVTWTIDSFLFSDGGTASGSFVYDADSNSYSNVSIVTTAGSVMGGAVYSYLNPNNFFVGPDALIVVSSQQADLTGTHGMRIDFSPYLTNAGGVVQLNWGLEALCANASCASPTENPQRSIISGQISAVPIPAAVWLFASGLGLLGWMRRNNTA